MCNASTPEGRARVPLAAGLLAGMIGLAGALAQAPADAAPRAVERFGTGTWATLAEAPRRPAAVVFSTTDCAHCPAVIAGLARDLHRHQPRAELLVVVMDAAPGEADAALLAHAPYRAADRLLAFDGHAPALRHGVDPRWRGVTPYVVFIAPGQPQRAVTGPPAAADIEAWWQASRAAARR